MLSRLLLFGILVTWLPWIALTAQAQSPPPAHDCEDANVVIVMEPGTSYTNECPETHYVVRKPYFDQILAGHESALLMHRALAERDTLIDALTRKTALLDSTWHAVSHLSDDLSAESLHALAAARDSLHQSVLPQLDAARQDLDAAAHRLRDANRRLFWSRVTYATLPALAGVGLGVLLAR